MEIQYDPRQDKAVTPTDPKWPNMIFSDLNASAVSMPSIDSADMPSGMPSIYQNGGRSFPEDSEGSPWTMPLGQETEVYI